MADFVKKQVSLALAPGSARQIYRQKKGWGGDFSKAIGGLPGKPDPCAQGRLEFLLPTRPETGDFYGPLPSTTNPLLLDRILLIFIRNPALGQVKTRLARTTGDVEALRIYRLLLDKTRAAALEAVAERWLWYSDFADQYDQWPTSEFHKMVQPPGDLGERMERAFQTAFDAGAGRVVIIGSDCPGLTGTILEEAFAALDTTDFVIGPVPDGGYYLLGMRTLATGLFRDVAWSTDTVRATTLDRIAAAGKSCVLLPLLTDVDTEDDWLGWLAKEN